MAFSAAATILAASSPFHQQFGRFSAFPKSVVRSYIFDRYGPVSGSYLCDTVTQAANDIVFLQPWRRNRSYSGEANTASWSIGLMVCILIRSAWSLCFEYFWLQRPAKPYGRRRIWTSDPSLSFCALPITKSSSLVKMGHTGRPKRRVNRSFKIGNSLGGGFGLVIICRYDNGHTR